MSTENVRKSANWHLHAVAKIGKILFTTLNGTETNAPVPEKIAVAVHTRVNVEKSEILSEAFSALAAQTCHDR